VQWLDVDSIRPFLSREHLALAEEVEAFARHELALRPEPRDDDEARREARIILTLIGEAGLLRYAVPEEYGGFAGAPDLRACCLIREALAAASPLADTTFALQALGSMPITLAGSEEQRRNILPAVARGERMAAFAMTEAAAGSDVAALATRARWVDDGWILDGDKAFISNAGLADFYCVFAKTQPDAGTRGITCFLVEAETVGLSFLRPQVLSSPHPLGELALTRCRLPAEARIGKPGEGFKVGMKTLDRLRPTVAAAACGMAARALDEALTHARRRQQFGKPLAEFQLIQEKLSRIATELAAARLLTYRAAWKASEGFDRITLEASMAKAFATEAAQRAVDDAVQVLGGRGLLVDSPVDRLYRSVRALRIYEGATEVHHLIIARELVRLDEA